MKVDLNIPESREGFILEHSGGISGSPVHQHDELEFNLVTRGQGWYLIDGARFPMRQGTLVWLFPAQQHMLHDRSRDFTMWVTVFRPRLVAWFSRSRETRWLQDREAPAHFLKQLPLTAFTQLHASCGQLAAAQEQADLFNAGLAHLMLQAWHLFETARSIYPQDLHPAVYKAAMLLTEADCTMAELCRKVSLSEAHLRRLFRAQLGASLTDFRNERRLARFVRLYTSNPRLDLTQAAFEAGFGSYPHFYRILRASYGYSPAEFKRRHAAPAPHPFNHLL